MHKFNLLQLTSIGDRAENQDYMLHKTEEDYALFVVADGLGGHQAGAMASRYFCHSFVNLADKYCRWLNYKSPEKVVSKWFNSAVRMMATAFDDDPVAYDAYTTCSILIITDNYTISAHCGDSRTYRINKSGIIWRTKDHSIPQKLFEEGELAEHKMGTHPEQNQLTRSVSIDNKFLPDINVYPAPMLGDTFILCSDGFWEFTKEHEFVTLASEEVQKLDLLKQARLAKIRANGKGDNLTIQWIRIEKNSENTTP